MKHWLDYRDLVFLGESNHGLYYRARPPARLGVDSDVAIKVLVRDSSDHQWKSVAREIGHLQQISSPYVVRFLEAGHDRGRLYFAMEYAVMGTLARPARALTRFERVRALAHGTRGLGIIHGMGVVHRDVKPAKILVHETGGRLNDLGISEDNFVSTGAVPTGSIGFMAPEVALGDHATPQSDIYSVGATLHLVLTGQSVFPDIPRQDLLAALQHVSRTPPVIAEDARFPELLSVVRDCLARDPAARPADAATVADRIEAALEPECREGAVA
ncbi:protein kinase [Rhodobacterales bacterium HKCCE2091]|nr:protein kinase [Rhodobacterales bacterium HKCCE2091]